MNDLQENKLSMYRTVQTVLNNNQAEFSDVAALGTQQTAFSDSIGMIDSLGQAQQSDTSGVTIDKANFSQQMMDKALQVAGGLMAFASVGKDTSLQKKAEVNKSTFNRARDEERDQIAQEIHDLANANLAALASYGITAATLTALQTRIDAYKLGAAGPQVAKAQRSSLTELLDQEFDRADMILGDRIDGLVEQFNGSGTTFYNDYKNARKIIGTGSKQKPAAPPPAPPP
ncbi:MAG: hypothetical protein ABJB22_02155 [Verrucomicrobiota bacterium]